MISLALYYRYVLKYALISAGMHIAIFVVAWLVALSDSKNFTITIVAVKLSR